MDTIFKSHFSIMLYFHKIFASALGLGFIPKGSGTFGALLACAMIAGIFQISNHIGNYQVILIVTTIVVTFLGRWSSGVMETHWGEDASKIVIDEVAGMCLSICLIPFTWQNLLIAFVLFRFFDIYKPFNIRNFEKYPNGWGVMLDDVMAGIWANGCLQLIVFFLHE
ncbi:phosphatidylglycerophosphatase A family protein [Arcicella rigui]|uniref:Phosphatidylglycerophosphatase A n=1 Tax=Arcicella rigui TaxID=797020 RepID=A0ABU5QA57_9BACT|nr:phosphatidylglycerophosphatase A [Arcicella rigui]MEA5139716.1 phosphatidylglycerophosphatase A [Arcicella rigui]